MASTCPKCHAVLENDIVCCADVRYTWKCRSCGKLTTGFAVPYGRCFLCGGKIEVIEGYRGAEPGQVEIVREAVQYELDMYNFYRLALKRAGDPRQRAVLEEMYRNEEEHMAELEAKYHVHLDADLKDLPASAQELVAAWIFEGVDFSSPEGQVVPLYNRAIEMERRTRDHFRARAEAAPPGPQKEIYSELAAEEEEHVSVLETERAQFLER